VTRRASVFLLIVSFAAGCGGRSAPTAPPVSAQRETAGRFAVALLRGETDGARALLVQGSDGALVFLVRRAIAPWKGQRVAIRLPPRSTGRYWAVGFARMRSHKNGSFERQSGDLVMSVTATAAGARIAFFTFENVRTRFSTHRDSQLLPSKR
jgi:hypothetical protein